MAWGGKTSIVEAALVVSGTSDLYSIPIDLNPGELANTQIVGNSAGTTDSLEIRLYGTLDQDPGPNWDTTALTAITLDTTDGNDNDISIPISGLYRCRFGFRRDGSTDNITVNASIRKDGVNL